MNKGMALCVLISWHMPQLTPPFRLKCNAVIVLTTNTAIFLPPANWCTRLVDMSLDFWMHSRTLQERWDEPYMTKLSVERLLGPYTHFLRFSVNKTTQWNSRSIIQRFFASTYQIREHWIICFDDMVTCAKPLQHYLFCSQCILK